MRKQVQRNVSRKGTIYVTSKEVPNFLFERWLLLTTKEVAAAKTTKKINAKAADAVNKGDKNELVRLLKAGAGKGALDKSGNSLIAIAGWNGDSDIARILLQHDFVEEELFTKEELITAHYYATGAGHTKVAELIKLYADGKV